jgi:hypothetical protein
MNTPARDEAPAGDGTPRACTGGTGRRPDRFAVTPAIGPVPATYVPRSTPGSGPAGLLWRAAIGAIRRSNGRGRS